MTVAELLGTSDGLAMLAETPAASSFERLIADAAAAGASTIHLEPSESIAKVRYRIDGMLQEGSHLSHRALEVLVAYIKHHASLHIDERRWAQEGTLHLDLGTSAYDVKVATIPVAHGEKAVLHLFNSRHYVHNMEELGLWGQSRKQLAKALGSKQGLIIVSSEHRGGASTTLRSLLKHLDSPITSLASLEEHITHRLPRVSQLKAVDDKGAVTAMRAAVAHDTDVIMVENMQRQDVFTEAIAAAHKGRLLLGGMHAASLAESIAHLQELSANNYELAHSLQAVIHQRLARRLCDNCKQPAKPTAADFRMLNNTTKVTLHTLQQFIAESKKHQHGDNKIALYQANPVGCAQCRHTGYKGQIGIFEVLPVSAQIQKQLVAGTHPMQVVQQAVKEGMMPLSVDGLVKALSGLTTLREALYATK